MSRLGWERSLAGLASLVSGVVVVVVLAGALASPLVAQLPGATAPRFTVELEAGPVWQSRNEARVPNEDDATLFSLRAITGSGPWPSGRLTLGWRFRERQEVRLILAPLSLTETGRSRGEIRFDEETFAPLVPLTATFTFNSWRASWRYRLHAGATTEGWIGFTAKVRDAVIALEQTVASPGVGTGSLREGRTTDLGFVPLLHLAGGWTPAPGWALRGEFDGLAGGPGRAFDVTAWVERAMGDGWLLRAGYRTIEGGADVDQVRSFAWLHYLLVGAEWRR